MTTNYQPSEIGLRIYPTHIVQYFVRDSSNSCRSDAQMKAALNLRQNSAKGLVSAKASKRIKNAVNWLASSAKFKRVYCKHDQRTYRFKLNFITLTLPSLDHGLTDHQFKNQLLRLWLERMRYRHKLHNYVWKVETQANGNIHAHITTDCFIHYSEIRDAWNSILIKKGLMRTFADQHGHSNPNSTDVKAVAKVKNIAAYLAKYFSKSDQDRRRVSGRLWSCSHSLSNSNRCTIVVPPTDDDSIIYPLVSSSAKHIYIDSEPNSMGLRRRLATVYLMSPSIWRELQSSAIGDHFTNHLKSIRENIPDNSINSLKFQDYAHTKFNPKPISSGTAKPDRSRGSFNIGASPQTSFLQQIPKSAFQYDLFQSIN